MFRLNTNTLNIIFIKNKSSLGWAKKYMHFDALGKKNHISKFLWSSGFRNWGRKKLKLLFYFIDKGFLHARNYMRSRPAELDEMRQHRRPLGTRRGLTRLGNGEGLWACFPEQSTGWGGMPAGSDWMGALCLSSQSLARMDGHEAGPGCVLLQSLNIPTTTRCLGHLTVFSS